MVVLVVLNEVSDCLFRRCAVPITTSLFLALVMSAPVMVAKWERRMRRRGDNLAHGSLRSDEGRTGDRIRLLLPAGVLGAIEPDSGGFTLPKQLGAAGKG